MSAAMTPFANEEIRPACGAGNGTRFGSSARRADKTVGFIHQVEHGRNDNGACENTDDQCHLLFPWRRVDELTGLKILQVIVRDRGDIEDDRGGEKRESH